MLVLLVLVIASSSFVSGVMSRQNVTLNDVTIGRNTVSPHYAYIYYDGHSLAPGASSPSYYNPGTHYHQYEGKWTLCHRGTTRPQDVYGSCEFAELDSRQWVSFLFRDWVERADVLRNVPQDLPQTWWALLNKEMKISVPKYWSSFLISSSRKT
jgi:hypothetical protein